MKAISVAEMRELDRRTIEDFGIPSIVLMENAGRRVSDVAMEMLKARTGSRAAIFCGTGNNGGDGFVAARYLARQGIAAEVY
ncbi:MAG: NAD(P)H-hydrate epimerase, partial [Candidatus Omnitrophota bacterium]